MNFWKLRINGNDFLLFHRNKGSAEKIELCSERFAGQPFDWIEVDIADEDIRCRIYEDGKAACDILDAIRCCAYWYMKSYEKDRCTITHQDKSYRMKTYKNLVTLEVSQPYGEESSEVILQDAMHFYIESGEGEGTECIADVYRRGYLNKELHRIAIGEDHHGKQLLRYSNNKVYISAPVHMVFEGNIRN